MRGYLIDIASGNNREIYDDSFEEYRKLIGCDYFDIVLRKIDGKYYHIICDEEGYLKNNPRISAKGVDGCENLVGNLIIFNKDEKGGLAALEDEDVDRIKKSICKSFSDNAGGPNEVYVLDGISY